MTDFVLKGEQNMAKELEGAEQSGPQEGLTRNDFLKACGVGLGAAGMVSLMGGAALAEGEKKGKYLVAITNGGNDPNRAILGLLMALTAAEKGWGEVHVWFTLEGADLACKAKAEKIDSPIFKKFGTAAEIMKKLKDKNATFGVCPPCAEYAGAVGGDKFDYVEKKAADWLMKNIQDSWVVWM
jgi:predicted peroxiredoxin